MHLSDIDTATSEQFAPLLLATLQRLGEIGGTGAIALTVLVDDGDTNFEEAASSIGDIAAAGIGE